MSGRNPAERFSGSLGEKGVAEANKLIEAVGAGEEVVMEQAEAAMQMGEGFTADAWGAVRACLLDDLNTPAAIAVLSEPLKMMNELLVVKKKKPVRLFSLFLFLYRMVLQT